MPSLKIRDLPRFASRLELSRDFIRELTGIDLNRFRRGKLDGSLEVPVNAAVVLTRIEAAFNLGLRLTSDEQLALEWLYASSATLGNRAPIDLAESDAGLAHLRHLVALVDTQPIPEDQKLQEPGKVPLPVAPQSESSRAGRFRISETLRLEIAKIPGLTQAELARRITHQGSAQMPASRISRLANGYADASWEEVVLIARGLGIETSGLVPS